MRLCSSTAVLHGLVSERLTLRPVAFSATGFDLYLYPCFQFRRHSDVRTG